MLARLFLVILFCIPKPITSDRLFNFVIWNVGQGSFNTFFSQDQCFHFDAGGEAADWHSLRRWCQTKKNWVLVTHDDWDHVSFIPALQRQVPDLCVFYPKPSRRRFLKNLPSCPPLPSWIQLLSFGSTGRDNNASSLVYLIKSKILVTGDAPMSEEKKWHHKVPQGLPILVLGHHGSQTSTSQILLQSSQPKIAVASARQSKHGHPHPRVLEKLKQQKVPVLRTETFGNLYFYIR